MRIKYVIQVSSHRLIEKKFLNGFEMPALIKLYPLFFSLATRVEIINILTIQK